MTRNNKKELERLHFAIDRKLADRLRGAVKATEDNPYPTTLSMIVRRGIDLALKELEEAK